MSAVLIFCAAALAGFCLLAVVAAAVLSVRRSIRRGLKRADRQDGKGMQQWLRE